MPGLVEAVARIRSHVARGNTGTYLLRLTQPKPHTWNLSPQELSSRQHALAHDTPPRSRAAEDAHTLFLRALYPVRNPLAALAPLQLVFRPVDHNELFRRYEQLRRPGVRELAHGDFEHFMATMLRRRDFVRPNLLSPATVHLFSDEDVVKHFLAAHRLRAAHRAKAWTVMNDMDAAGIPVSEHEQRSMLYMTYYRDRPAVVDAVRKAVASLPKQRAHELQQQVDHALRPSFDYDTFREMRDTLGVDSADKLNLLLHLAVRHGNARAVAELEQAPQKNRRTHSLLLEHYASTADVGKFAQHLHAVPLELIDIGLLNAVIYALAQLDRPELVAELVAPFTDQESTLTPDEQFLKLLTLADRQRYRAHLDSYEGGAVRLQPTEATYLPLLRHYAATGAFAALTHLLAQAETVWKLPLSTAVFSTVFREFAAHPRPVGELRHVLATAVARHDVYSNDPHIADAVAQNRFGPETTAVLATVLRTETPFPTDQGLHLKMSNRLVRQVFAAFMASGSRAFVQEVGRMESRLLADIRQAYGAPGGRNASATLCQRQQVAHVKRSALLALVELAACEM